MLVAMLPRFAWMNPEMSSGIFGEFNSMRGLFWACGAVTDMNFVCYYLVEGVDITKTVKIFIINTEGSSIFCTLEVKTGRTVPPTGRTVSIWPQGMKS